MKKTIKILSILSLLGGLSAWTCSQNIKTLATDNGYNNAHNTNDNKTNNIKPLNNNKKYNIKTLLNNLNTVTNINNNNDKEIEKDEENFDDVNTTVDTTEEDDDIDCENENLNGGETSYLKPVGDLNDMIKYINEGINEDKKIIEKNGGIIFIIKDSKSANLFINDLKIDMDNFEKDLYTINIIDKNGKKYTDTKYFPVISTKDGYCRSIFSTNSAEYPSIKIDNGFEFKANETYTIEIVKNNKTIMKEKVTANKVTANKVTANKVTANNVK